MDTVYVRLIGGLGNQLFQYATARALALRNAAQVKLDLTGFETYGLRRYELDSYPIKATVAEPVELSSLMASRPLRPKPTGIRRVFRKLMPSHTPDGAAKLHYREPHYHFDPGLGELKPPVLLDGYWQSERYFANAASTLHRELTPHKPLDDANARFADEIRNTNAVSLHVRRGDYVSNAHTNAYHGTCSLDYYFRAITHVADRTEGAHLFVFSDDHDWTAAHLRSNLPTTYVTANPPDRGFRDMQLMSMCKHHVVANSSFSWWGAWLNAKDGKIVVAPKHWFARGDNDTRDLVPSNWVRL